jgi:hypothetical protein
MDQTTKDSNEQFKKAPRLGLGENTCNNCLRKFIVGENKLPMPGTKDFESVYCPYCKTYNGDVFINGNVYTRIIDN